MEIGTKIITLIDKNTTEGLKSVTIPKGTIGAICEIHDKYVLVEIWGENAPNNIEGVFDFKPYEIEQYKGFKKFKKPN